MFNEYLEVVQACWEEGMTTFKGKFVDFENIWVIPKPVQKPGPPIYIAVSTSPESVDNAAKRGLPIIVGGPTTTIGQTPQVVSLWHERMEHYGNPHEHIDLPSARTSTSRPPWSRPRTTSGASKTTSTKSSTASATPPTRTASFPKTTGTGSTATATASKPDERAREEGILPLIGTPEVVCERIEALRSKGINRIFGKFGAAGLDFDKSLRCIEMFAKEVMPEFAGGCCGGSRLEHLTTYQHQDKRPADVLHSAGCQLEAEV